MVISSNTTGSAAAGDTTVVQDDSSALLCTEVNSGSIKTAVEKITACNTGAIVGTVTANLSATDNAVLDDLATSLAIIDDWDSTDHCNIRHLNSTDDTVNSVCTNAGIFAVQAAAAPGVDVGDVTINNASSAAAVNIQDGGNTITVDGTVAVTNAALTSIDGKMVTGTDIGDVTINNASGASAVNIQDGGNTITVDGTVAVTNADITSCKTALELLDNSVDGNYLNVNMNIAGADVSATVPVPVRPNEFELASITTHVKKYYTSAGAVTDGIIWSPAGGKRWYVTDIIVQVSAAATLTLEDDLAAGDAAILKMELAANSGFCHSFTTPWYSGEDAADLMVTTSAGNVYITVTGYEI